MRDRFKSRFIVFGFIILFLRPHRSFLGLRLPRICFQSELESDRERERERERARKRERKVLDIQAQSKRVEVVSIVHFLFF